MRPVQGLRVRELHRDFEPEFLERLYRQILKPAFQPEELEDPGSLAERLTAREPGSLVAVASDQEGEIVGGLVADLDRDCGVLLISYVAVRPELRGQGIGSFLLQRVAESWYASEGVMLAVGEVHDPRRWAERDPDSGPRLRLFGRLGARVLDTPFVQPALHADSARVPGFLLIALHVDPAVRRSERGREGIPSELLSRFVRSYFRDAEGVEEPYDPELASLLDRIERDELVELIPVDEYERVSPLGADA